MSSETDLYALYRSFIAEFASTIDPFDQLPIRISGYCLKENEIYGEVVDWIMNYLSIQ